MRLRPQAQNAPGLSGVTVSCDGGPELSLQRGKGGLDAREVDPSAQRGASGRSSAPRAARAASSARASARRCSAIRPTIRLCAPRASCARHSDGMSTSFEVVEHPARACAALMVGAATHGGHIVLAGGSTPRAAYEHFVHAVRAVGVDLSSTTFWIGDERCVEPDDDRSNYR